MNMYAIQGSNGEEGSTVYQNKLTNQRGTHRKNDNFVQAYLSHKQIKIRNK